jgi:hypothetical protein
MRSGRRATPCFALQTQLGDHRPTPTILDYRGVGHAVGAILPNIPTETEVRTRYGSLYLGGSRLADERAREQAWPRMLAWLARIR